MGFEMRRFLTFVLCFLWTISVTFAGTIVGPTSLGHAVYDFAGPQFGVQADALGAPSGTMSSYAVNDAITLQCTGVSFATPPVIQVTGVVAGAVTQQTVKLQGVTTGILLNGGAACTQASTTGSGTGYQVAVQFGVMSSGAADFIANNVQLSQTGGLTIAGNPNLANSSLFTNQTVTGTCLSACGVIYARSGNWSVSSSQVASMIFGQLVCCGQSGTTGIAGYSASIGTLSESGTTVTAVFPNQPVAAIPGESVVVATAPSGYNGTFPLLTASVGASNTTVTYTAGSGLSPCVSSCGTIAATFGAAPAAGSFNETVAFDPLFRQGTGGSFTGVIGVGHAQANAGGYTANFTSISEPSGTTATVAFPTPTPVPAVGSTFFLTGVTPSGYNNQFTVGTVSNISGTSTITFTTTGALGNGGAGAITAYLSGQTGLNIYSELASAATYWLGAQGAEFDLYAQAGTHSRAMSGVSVVLEGANAAAPDSGVFPAFSVAAQNGATATISCAYCIGGYAGVNALASTASIMQWIQTYAGSSSGPTITNGFYFPTLTFTGFAYDTPGATIDGSGNGVVHGVTVTAAAQTAAAGQISYGGTTAAATNCGSLASSLGCVLLNIAGTNHYVPYY